MVKLFIRALDGGATRTSLSSARWNISGDCEETYWSTVTGRPRQNNGNAVREYRDFEYAPGKAMPLFLDLGTRCRKCASCRKARSNEWRWRIRHELQASTRSWFGTLTLSPEAHYRMMSLARHNAAARGLSWETLSPDERYKRVCATSLKEVTKYVKRVRKQSGVPLRTICVTEQHKSGLPHFHMLVHEVELKPVTHRILASQWTLGFEKWRLVPFDDLRHARYLCKYITKQNASRIRASIAYGKSIATVGAVLTMNRNGL